MLQLDLRAKESREEHAEMVLSVLRKLEREIKAVRRQDYPENPVSGIVLINGMGCVDLASALAYHFRAAGWLECEENASALWVKAALAAFSHYHHVVGPAMLANADCHERLGHTEHAMHMYIAVLGDFAFIVEEWSDESGPPNEESRVALESLRAAALRLLSNGIHEFEGGDVQTILLRGQKRSCRVLL